MMCKVKTSKQAQLRTSWIPGSSWFPARRSGKQLSSWATDPSSLLCELCSTSSLSGSKEMKCGHEVTFLRPPYRQTLARSA